MATIVFGAIGAGIGSMVGNPMLGWSIGTTIGGIFDTLTQPGNSMSTGWVADLRVGGSSYGTAIPYAWGNNLLPGIIIWSTDLQEHDNKQSVGGGSGGGATVDNYSYTVSLAVAYQQGVMKMADGTFVKRNVVVNKIWADDLIIWDSTYIADNGAGSLTVTPTFYDGDENQAADPTIVSAIPNTPAYRGLAYFTIENLDLTDWSNRVPNFMIETQTDDVTVGDILGDICGLVGLDSTLTDFSQATDSVAGYFCDQQTSAQDTIDPLCQIYSLDLSEIDGKIVAVKRGVNDIVLTVDTNDFGAQIITPGSDSADSNDTSGNSTIFLAPQTKRAQDAELPSEIELIYYSTDSLLQQYSQSAIRQYARVWNNVQMPVKMAFDDTTAAQVAQKLLDTAWVERLSYVFALPKYGVSGNNYLQLAPADCIYLPVNNQLHRVRITSIEIGNFGQLSFEAIEDDGAVITQIKVGGSSGSTNNQSMLAIIPSDFVCWSGTELRASDQSSAGFYVGAQGHNGNSQWRGGSIYYLLAATGSNWSLGGTITSPEVFGVTTNELADSPVASGDFDNASTVRVSLVDGDLLASTTAADVLNNANNIAICGNEIIGFTTATLVETGIYDLTGLYRGLRNSPMTGHAANEQFILANTNLQRVTVPNTAIGTVVQVKVVSAYQQLTDVTAENVTIAAPTISAQQAQINALKNAPYYRMRGYTGSGIGNGTTIDDSWFSGGANFPAGKTQRNFTRFASGPGGSFSYETPGLTWVLWARMGLANSGTDEVTVNYWIPTTDNAVTVRFNGAVVISSTNNNELSGTFTVGASSQGLFEVFYANTGGGNYDTGNQGVCEVIIDALDQVNMAFYDPGI